MSLDQSMRLKTNLEYLMRVEGLTVVKLASRSGIPKQTVHNWLCGASPRSMDQLKKLAVYFKLTVDELCFGDLSKNQIQEESPLVVYGKEIRAGIFQVVLRPT